MALSLSSSPYNSGLGFIISPESREPPVGSRPFGHIPDPHLFLVLPLPEINLDAYKGCLYERWRLGEFVFASQTTIFGTSEPLLKHPAQPSNAFRPVHFPQWAIADVFAFSVIFIVARRPRIRHPRIPSLLDIILRDATVYFMVIFALQMCFLLFLCFAPVSDLRLPGGGYPTVLTGSLCPGTTPAHACYVSLLRTLDPNKPLSN